MEDMIYAMSRLFTAKDATERFDKEALVLQHEIAARQHREVTAAHLVFRYLSVPGPTPDACSLSLQHLRSIPIGDLILDSTHRGRVLFGTLCVNPFKMVGTITLLEDDQGRAVRVAIYNVPASDSTPAALNAKYPNGAKVAIKEPYIKEPKMEASLSE